MKIAIAGGGKVGYYLALALIEHNHQPILIEKDKKVCEHLANTLDVPVICGDATLPAVLKSSNIADCEALVCVSGSDEVNLVCAQLAKSLFDIKKTVVRANNPKNEVALKTLGIDIVINSTDKIVGILEREADVNEIRQILDVGHGAGHIFEIVLPEKYAFDETPISEMKIPPYLNIVSITRNNSLIIPRGNIKLRSGDTLLVIAENVTEQKLKTVFKI